MTAALRGGSGQDSSAASSTPLPGPLPLTIQAHAGAVNVARYDSRGRYLLSAGVDRTVKLWSISTLTDRSISSSSSSSSSSSTKQQPLKTYTSGHSYEILGLDITADNSKFASAGGDKNVNVWDVATGTILRRFNAHTGRIDDVRFAGSTASGGQNQSGNSSSGGGDQVLITAGFDSILRFYDLRAQGAWRPLMECKEAKDAILTIDVGADGGNIVSTGSVDGVVRQYDVRKGELRQDTIDEPIVSLTSSANGSMMLVSSTSPPHSQATHRLLDTSDGSLLQSCQGHTNKSYRCHSTLSAAREDLVLAGDETGQLRVWDVLSGKPKRQTGTTAASPHKRAILWTECSPVDAGHVVTAGADGLLALWQP
ncbi:unnamed protein product [Jaminaea pallidilutea]